MQKRSTGNENACREQVRELPGPARKLPDSALLRIYHIVFSAGQEARRLQETTVPMVMEVTRPKVASKSMPAASNAVPLDPKSLPAVMTVDADEAVAHKQPSTKPPDHLLASKPLTLMPCFPKVLPAGVPAKRPRVDA